MTKGSMSIFSAVDGMQILGLNLQARAICSTSMNDKRSCLGGIVQVESS